MMTSTSDIAAKFAAAIAVFAPIVGLSKDDDLCNIRKVIVQIWLSISLAGSTSGKVTGLILVDSVYVTTTGINDVSFKEGEDLLDEYNPKIKKESRRGNKGSLPPSGDPVSRTKPGLPPQSTAAANFSCTPLTRSTTSPSAA